MAKSNPDDRLYSEEHEWALDNGDGTITMGITDHAQELLTDIVYVELPEIGKKVRKMEPIAVVESVKSVSDVYSPVSGEVVEVNEDLEDQPELINEDAFGDGWIVKISMDDPSELDDLMEAAAYTALIEEEKEDEEED
ncbi:MAG TPA: glycine cleavage system protein GcvH [Deltaproteobacteria bacterium]|mgnify:CR=1 FL=1|nr:glycine cleavage system protein GcvH [Deltaproteobacteria bacterium]